MSEEEAPPAEETPVEVRVASSPPPRAPRDTRRRDV